MLPSDCYARQMKSLKGKKPPTSCGSLGALMLTIIPSFNKAFKTSGPIPG